MPRESVILECTEARKEGKPPSRYMSTRNKKLQTDPVEKKKYNRFLKGIRFIGKLKVNLLLKHPSVWMLFQLTTHWSCILGLI